MFCDIALSRKYQLKTHKRFQYFDNTGAETVFFVFFTENDMV